jgi:FkbM family methyltransferase
MTSSNRTICKSIDHYTYLCYKNDTISNSLHQYGYWENNLIKHAEKYLNDESIILDIGANIGTWSIPLAIKKRTIHSFEPYDSSFYSLCGNIFVNNKEHIIYPYHAALIDDINKKTTMYLSETVNMGGCKLIETNNNDSKVQRYKLLTLDSLKLEKVDFIKLDVEGQELNVIKGGRETIMKNKPVIFFECWAIDSPHWDKITNTHYELMDYMKSLGYTINKVNIDGNDNYEAIPIF